MRLSLRSARLCLRVRETNPACPRRQRLGQLDQAAQHGRRHDARQARHVPQGEPPRCRLRSVRVLTLTHPFAHRMSPSASCSAAAHCTSRACGASPPSSRTCSAHLLTRSHVNAQDPSPRRRRARQRLRPHRLPVPSLRAQHPLVPLPPHQPGAHDPARRRREAARRPRRQARAGDRAQRGAQGRAPHQGRGAREAVDVLGGGARHARAERRRDERRAC